MTQLTVELPPPEAVDEQSSSEGLFLPFIVGYSKKQILSNRQKRVGF